MCQAGPQRIQKSQEHLEENEEKVKYTTTQRQKEDRKIKYVTYSHSPVLLQASSVARVDQQGFGDGSTWPSSF